jgi:hypothetical protein
MTEQGDKQADLILVDRHIEELNLRIEELKERMSTMASQHYETRNQSLLLSTMQDVMKDLKLLRLDLLGALGTAHDHSHA